MTDNNRVEFVVAIEKTFNKGNLEGCRVTNEFPMPNRELAERKVRSILANKEKFEKRLDETIHSVNVRVRLLVDSKIESR
jgi:hypothetical protein